MGERKSRPSDAGRLTSREDLPVDARGLGPPTSLTGCVGLRCLCRTREGASSRIRLCSGSMPWSLRWRSRESPLGGNTPVRCPTGPGGSHERRCLCLTRELWVSFCISHWIFFTSPLLSIYDDNAIGGGAPTHRRRSFVILTSIRQKLQSSGREAPGNLGSTERSGPHPTRHRL